MNYSFLKKTEEVIQIKVDKIDDVAQKHYIRVLAKQGKEQNVTDRLNKKINNVLTPSLEKAFFKRLKFDLLNPKNSLITAKPFFLQNFILSYQTNYAVLLNNKKFKEDLLSIFYYGDYDKWDAYQLAIDLNVKVCPYCNRQYTFTIGTSKAKGTRPQFDHFFDKATYPFLALSFYNLIPSCSICNSSLKGCDKFELKTHIHPYMDGFNDKVKFSIGINKIDFINGKPDSFTLRFKPNVFAHISKTDFKRINNNIKSFRLVHLYNQHKDYIAEIIQKSIAYNDDYYEALYKKFNGTLFNSVDDVKKMVLSNYITEDELGNRTLSKLTKDIAEELGIL